MYAGHEGRGAVVVPPLPAIVELDMEPFFLHDGYVYHYHDDHRWTYSPSRNGPWRELPRGHYPKELRWKGKGPGWKYRYDND
jgi:hypothetical protein